MRRLTLLIALAALALLALPAVAWAADPTPVPVVDPSAPVAEPSAVPGGEPGTQPPATDPTTPPDVTPSEDPTTTSPGDPGSGTPAEPPVACAPDDPACALPIDAQPLPCPTGAEVCAMAGGVLPGGGVAPGGVAPGEVLPAGGMFFSITRITDGTTAYDVAGTITMTPDGLSASVGCNTIAAPATWDAATNTLTITGAVVSTKMACMGDPGAAEALLVQLLGAGSVTWDGTTLAGAGIKADAMVAMADGVNPIYLANDNGLGSGAVTSGSGTGAEAAPITVDAKAVSASAAAADAADAAGKVLPLTVAAMALFLLAGGMVARWAARRG